MVTYIISYFYTIDLIITTLGAPGNQRVINLGISKGVLNIDGENDRIFFEIESRHIYSEPGENVAVGNIVVFTEKKGKINDVTLTKNYGEKYNIIYQKSVSIFCYVTQRYKDTKIMLLRLMNPFS